MAYEIVDRFENADRTTDLGNVQTDGATSSNGLVPITLPGGDADQALLIPLEGSSVEFTVSGIITGSLATLQAFITKANKWVNDGGNLDVNNLTYNSDLDGSGISVRALRFSKRWVAGNPRILTYELDLVQGIFI